MIERLAALSRELDRLYRFPQCLVDRNRLAKAQATRHEMWALKQCLKLL